MARRNDVSVSAGRRNVFSYFVPLILSASFFALFIGFSHFRKKPLLFEPYGDIRPTLAEGLHFLGWAALIIFVVPVVDAFVFHVVMARRRNVIAPQLLRQIVAIVLYLFLFAVALKHVLNYNITTSALTGGAVLAAVIGLALQDTLGNLFSGIALHMEGAFDVGDVVHSGDYVGVVEGVTWRATRIRGFNNQVIVLPNSVIARERLEV